MVGLGMTATQFLELLKDLEVKCFTSARPMLICCLPH